MSWQTLAPGNSDSRMATLVRIREGLRGASTALQTNPARLRRPNKKLSDAPRIAPT